MTKIAKLSFSLPMAYCGYIAASTASDNLRASALSMPNTRRAFLNRASVATTGVTMGWVLNQQHPGGCACGQCSPIQHSASCDCGMCSGNHVAGCQCGSCLGASHDAGCTCGACLEGGHGANCGCGQCGAGAMKLGFRPPAANAFEKREVGGENRSAETAAMNIQNQKSYERLEKSGFPLDSREEESARLSDALSSFSYPSSSTPSSKDRKDNKSKK